MLYLKSLQSFREYVGSKRLWHGRVFLLAIALATAANGQAPDRSLPEKIRTMPQSQVMALGKTMAEGIADASPAQVDSTTYLLAAVFSPQTNTLIYQYESTVPINDTASLSSKVARYHCADPIRKAFMDRGIRFKHVYITPSGQREVYTSARDCN